MKTTFSHQMSCYNQYQLLVEVVMQKGTNLQGKELGVEVLCILKDVHNLEPHVWIVLQVPQNLICCRPLHHQYKGNQVKDKRASINRPD